METQYSEITRNAGSSENRSHITRERKILSRSFLCSFGLSLMVLVIVAYCFCNNNVYHGEEDWIVQHDVIGTYGDFIGGVLGTLVALYSAYLLVRTLGNQLSVNSDVMRTNGNIIDTNNITIYQTNLQIFDNKFCAFFDNYKSAKHNYQCEAKYSHKKKVIDDDGHYRTIEEENIVTHTGSKAIDYIASAFSSSSYSDKRTYLSRAKSATNKFDELYAQHRREMSVHFRNLYLLTKFIGETDNFDEDGKWKIKEADRVEYAKSIRGQLSEGEMILLRYNCMTSRGEKMRPFVNQFNLIKHLPLMSLLEFRIHRSKLNSDREANTLDSHFIELKKKIKDYIGYAANNENANWPLSVRYSIEMNLSADKKQFTLTIIRKKNRPATGSDGTPVIEKALNRFTSINDIEELYKDFVREVLIVSNFYLYNGQKNRGVTGTHRTDDINDYAVIEYNSQYPIIVAFDA